jgi:hypothetical protein
MTIKKWGRNLEDAIAGQVPPEPSAPSSLPRIGEAPTMDYVNERPDLRVTEAPETFYIKEAERLAYETTRYLENAPAGSPGVAQARATLALAASVDAMREMLADRLDQIGAALVDPPR